jgi:hypothetical protein
VACRRREGRARAVRERAVALARAQGGRGSDSGTVGSSCQLCEAQCQQGRMTACTPAEASSLHRREADGGRQAVREERHLGRSSRRGLMELVGVAEMSSVALSSDYL